jgi:hypothetical protein
MAKHFGPGECLDCDTCGTAFYQDPVDLNETCRDCIDGKPIPRCVDCDEIVKRDERGPRCKGCDDKHFDKLMREKGRRQREERIVKEGFETSGYDCDPCETCEYRLFVKPKGRWMHKPCGDPAVVELQFAGPQNPKGVNVKLCRKCLGRHVRDLVGYLES